MAISAQHTRFVTNDYVNALPAEDLIKVAMKKQEMYDEGRKQIKQNLDSYGKLRGMLLTDDERNYFDQELNKMVKNVQENAGLDFSNMSNVESVINLGKPFENDEYIKAGIDWGVEYQNRQKTLSSTAKDKRNADNDLVYMRDIQEHMEKGGLGQKVQKNKAYVEYSDITKELREIEEKVNAEAETVFEQGPTGYIKQIEVKRKTREQIMQRLSASLTPAQQSQLQIHAQANMYRLGNEVLYQTWVGHNKEEKLMFDQAKKEAMVRKSELMGIDPKKRTAKQNFNLKELDNIIQKSDSYITAASENINMNPDNFDMGEYVPFFTSRFISGIAGNLVKNEVKVELKDDIAYKLNTEHRNKLSILAAEGAQDRLTKQFEFEQENYSVGSSVSLNSLSRVNNYMGKGFKVDPTQLPSDQIDKVINQLYDLNNEKAQKLSPAQVEGYVRELRTLQNVYKTYEGTTGSRDKISLNRSQGLGRVETSIDDFLTRPVTDIFNSGLTLEAMQFRTDLGGSKSKGKATPEQKAKDEKEKLVQRGIQGGLTPGQADSTAKQTMLDKAQGKSNNPSKSQGWGEPSTPVKP